MNTSDGTNPTENNPNSSQPNGRKKGKGRQKLKMEKIENAKNLQVTFSKRRAGLFKKASELTTLCGAESAIMVFSSSNKPHTYGHPSVETIANRFLNTNGGPTPPTNQLLATRHGASNRQLNQELIHKEGLLARERQRNKELNHMVKPNIEEMNYEELKQLQKDVLGFKSIFQSRLKNTASLGSSTNILKGPNLDQQSGQCVGFTNPGGFDMSGFPNISDPTHLASSSTSYYYAHVDPNMRYMVQYPHSESGSTQVGGGGGSYNILIPENFNNPNGVGDTMASTYSDTEIEVGTQGEVSNKTRDQGARYNNGHE